MKGCFQMKASWQLKPWSEDKNYYTVSIDAEKVHGCRSIFGPSLVLDLEIEKQKNMSLSEIFLISGYVSEKQATDLSPLVIPSQLVNPNKKRICLPLTDQQIMFIEEWRNGGPLDLYISLAGVACNSDNQASPKTCGLFNNGSWELLRIERERWLTILENLTNNTLKRKLIEIPVPQLPKNNQKWIEVIGFYERAVAFERKGEYNSALQECRKVVEGIKEVLVKHWELNPKLRFSSQLDSMEDKLKKLWGEENTANISVLISLFKSTWEFSSNAHHYGRGNIGTRHQVLFLFEILSALLMYAGLLVEEKQEI